MRIKVVMLLFIVLLPAVLFGIPIVEQMVVSVEPSKLKIPLGGEETVTVKVIIPSGYHIYGNPLGPGTGKPTTVVLKKHPRYLEVGPVRYPTAKKHYEPGDKGHVWIHEGKINILVPIKAKDGAKVGEIKAEIEFDALLCGKGMCIPVQRNIPVQIAIVSTSVKDSFVYSSHIVMNKNFENSHKKEEKSKLLSMHVEDAVTSIEFSPRYIEIASVRNIIHAIIFGFLGGLILNIMPCVLPVVSIKVLSFVAMGSGDRKKIIFTSLVFSLGILIVFLILASLMAFFGHAWGELFKHKIFLIAMITIVFAFALSLFDVFTITPSFSFDVLRKEIAHPYADAFLKGIFATFLATPCSGPFLGGTLAWLIMQPSIVVFIVFTFIGVGMAFPYLILATWPTLLRFVPKPGEWTIVFEKIMGFFLLGTVVYLIGIMEKSDVVPMLWFLLFVLVAFWQYGKYGNVTKPLKERVLSRVLLFIIIAMGYFLAFHVKWDNNFERNIFTKVFSFEALLENKSKGKISMVQFTAEWCPNCKVVERTSLYTDKVKKAMEDHRVELLVADITRKNVEAEILMRKLKANSIPLLAVFPPGDGFLVPICMRDMYSEKAVLLSIEEAVKYAYKDPMGAANKKQ